MKIWMQNLIISIASIDQTNKGGGIVHILSPYLFCLDINQDDSLLTIPKEIGKKNTTHPLLFCCSHEQSMCEKKTYKHKKPYRNDEKQGT